MRHHGNQNAQGEMRTKYISYSGTRELFPAVKVCLYVTFLQPQTKFAKVMFSQVSVCPWRGVCLPGGSATPPGQTPLVDTLLPSACWDTPLPSACWDTHPRPMHAGIHPPSRYYGIWSTSGRYASWNAFLFILCPLLLPLLFSIVLMVTVNTVNNGQINFSRLFWWQ